MSDSQPQEHIVRRYGDELRSLRDLLARMGGLVESQVATASLAVLGGDTDAATRVVAQDPQVDALEEECEQFVIRTLALRQPVAQDLRQIVAALKISGDLERIGDYAANVAKRALVVSRQGVPLSLSGLGHMARLVQDSLKLTIDAIGENDPDKAEQVWRSDEAVDDIYNALFREFVTYMMEDPRNISVCTHLLFIAKNLERIGDHATNIAELVHYAATGESLPADRPKGDSTAFHLPQRGASA